MGKNKGNKAAHPPQANGHGSESITKPNNKVKNHSQRDEVDSPDDAVAHLPVEAFLPDEVLAQHIFFRILLWFANIFAKPFNGFDTINFAEQDRTKAALFYTRHSTHNGDILTLTAICWETCQRVTRMLLHRLLLKYFPQLRYIGGVAGERQSAIALLKAGYWNGVIPGGADEGLVGHENCYRLHWPKQRVGFAKVAMTANAPLIPFFVRNVEESRFNPFLEFWHVIKGYLLFEWLMKLNLPVITPILYTMAHVIWFSATFFQIPIPVRCTMIFGDPVPYVENDSTDDVVKRCHDALQDLIIQHQPNALEGRNYTRALGERWAEWRQAKPKLIRSIESVTPKFIKRYLANLAKSKKKSA